MFSTNDQSQNEQDQNYSIENPYFQIFQETKPDLKNQLDVFENIYQTCRNPKCKCKDTELFVHNDLLYIRCQKCGETVRITWDKGYKDISDIYIEQIKQGKQSRSFEIANQCGKHLFITNDGIFINDYGKTKKYEFPTELNLSDNWFANPNKNKASVSISGNFVYLIDRDRLYLLTLTSQSIYIDVLQEGVVFFDADFSFEETVLFALTNNNQCFIFSLIPAKKLQEYSFNWKMNGKATSFQLGEPQRFILVKNDNNDKAFFRIRDNYVNPNSGHPMTLNPVDDSFGSIFDPYPDEQVISDGSIDDEESQVQPTTLQEIKNALMKKGLELREFESELAERMKVIESQIEDQERQKTELQKGFNEIEETMQNLFRRIQSVIERAYRGRNIGNAAALQKQAQKKLDQIHIPEYDVSGRLIHEFRILSTLCDDVCASINALLNIKEE